MPPRLILRLGVDANDTLEWFRLDRDGALVDEGNTAEPATLAESAAGHRIQAFAPGSRILLTSATVPTRNRQKLLQALPYALEDQLADDVDQLHCVPGEPGPSGEVAVAVVERQWLDTWMQRLGEAGLQPECVIPDVLCLPRTDDWSVLVEADGCLVRTGHQRGLASEPGNLSVLLETALAEAGDERPEHLQVLQVAEADNPLPSAVDDVPVSTRSISSAAPLLAEGVSGAGAINLLTGSYSQDGGWRGLWRPWRIAGSLLLAWLLLHTGQMLLEQRSLRAELDVVEAEIKSLMQEVLPDVRDISQARSRVEQRLSRLHDSAHNDGSGLIDTLLVIAPAMQDNDGNRIEGMNWRRGNLELDISTTSLQQLDELKRALDSLSGIEVEVRSARGDNDRVQGRLQVRRR